MQAMINLYVPKFSVVFYVKVLLSLVGARGLWGIGDTNSQSCNTNGIVTVSPTTITLFNC